MENYLQLGPPNSLELLTQRIVSTTVIPLTSAPSMTAFSEEGGLEVEGLLVSMELSGVLPETGVNL